MYTNGSTDRLENHRRSFITEDDYRWLADNGINAVRIPVGYWVLGGDAPYADGSRYLDWAFVMAKKYRLSVIIDVHGLPGSQNGFDHSGRKGNALWFDEKYYRTQSLMALERIAKRYGDHPNLWGIQVINEPKVAIFHFKLRQYYRAAYKLLAGILPTGVRIIFSDAFSPRLMNGAMKQTTHRSVMDVHFYHMATLFAHSRTLDWFFQKTIRRKKLIQRLSKTQEIIIGEWSGIVNQEKLNGLSLPEQYKLFQEYVALQLSVYEAATGWFYFNYKTEKPGVWNFRSQIEAGNIKL